MSGRDVPEWAIERVLAQANQAGLPDAALWTLEEVREAGDTLRYTAVVRAFARYIAEHEEEPVDPLLIEAIELVINDDVSRTQKQIDAIRERRAGHEKVNLALAALRRGMELAKERQP